MKKRQLKLSGNGGTVTPGVPLPVTPPEGDGGASAGNFPVLGVFWCYRYQIPGAANLSVNHGPLLRADYPDAWEIINGMGPNPDGEEFVISDANWLNNVSGYGECDAFSTGDGSTTFRVPLAPWVKGHDKPGFYPHMQLVK